MLLIRFLKRNNLIIAFLYLSSIGTTVYSQIKKENALIIEVVTKTKDKNTFWALHYIVIQDRVYSGDIFHGRNLSCKISKNYFDTVQNYLVPPAELSLLEKKMDKIKYKKFKTSSSYVDTNFYWKSISIPIEYLELPCKVETPDFFKFIYKQQPNGLCITSINLNKMKKSNFPKFFLDQIIQNEKCLKTLESSYKNFEGCLNN